MIEGNHWEEEGNQDFFLQMNSGGKVTMTMKLFQVRSEAVTALFGIARNDAPIIS